MPLLDDGFRPAPLLANPHAQTVLGNFLRGRPLPWRRERVDTPDGDFLDLDWLDGDAGAPTVLVLHGLEGSSASSYVRELAGVVAARRWSAVVLNYRSCGGTPNRTPLFYNSGDTRDARFVLSRIPGRKFAVGFSLGGSVLLNLLAQDGAATGLSAGVAVSTPYDLDACATCLDSGQGFAPVYLLRFMHSLKRKALAKAAQFPGVLDPARIRAARTIRAFDDAVTAQLYGFGTAERYYAACSTAGQLARIAVPTLLVSADDDPIAPARLLPDGAHESPHLHVLRTRHGGHVGYLGGSPLAPRWWAEARAVEWLAER